MAEQPDDAARELIAIGGIDEQAGHAVVDDLGGGAARTEAGASGAHRLDEDEAEALVAARHHERGAALVLARQRLVVDAAEEADAAVQPARRGLLLEPRPIV